MPKLVVMMPARNAAETIGTAIRSALKAMPNDSELVVWDDASTDATPAVVAAVADRRVRLIVSSASVGSGRARAEIMKQSSSDFVACMDADDVCFPWRFRAQFRHLLSSDVSFGATVRFSGRGASRRIRPSNMRPLSADSIRTALLFHNPLSQPTMSARRSSLEAVGGYRDLPVAQDYDLWLRCSTSGLRLTKIGVPLVAYRESHAQISRSEDYYDRVRASVPLREAYLAHLAMTNPEAFSLVEQDLNASDISAEFEGLLLSQAAGDGRANHEYYQKLVRRQGTFLTFR